MKNERIYNKWNSVFKALKEFNKEENPEFKANITINLCDQLTDVNVGGSRALTDGASAKYSELFYAIKALQNMQYVDQLNIGKTFVIYLYEKVKKETEDKDG